MTSLAAGNECSWAATVGTRLRHRPSGAPQIVQRPMQPLRSAHQALPGAADALRREMRPEPRRILLHEGPPLVIFLATRWCSGAAGAREDGQQKLAFLSRAQVQQKSCWILALSPSSASASSARSVWLCWILACRWVRLLPFALLPDFVCCN